MLFFTSYFPAYRTNYYMCIVIIWEGFILNSKKHAQKTCSNIKSEKKLDILKKNMSWAFYKNHSYPAKRYMVPCHVQKKNMPTLPQGPMSIRVWMGLEKHIQDKVRKLSRWYFFLHGLWMLQLARISSCPGCFLTHDMRESETNFGSSKSKPSSNWDKIWHMNFCWQNYAKPCKPAAGQMHVSFFHIS